MIGKQHRADLECTRCAALEVQLHSVYQAVHDGLAQTVLIQNIKAGIGCGRLHQRFAHLFFRARKRRIRAEKLRATVRHAGVRVHNTACDLHELTDMPDE